MAAPEPSAMCTCASRSPIVSIRSIASEWDVAVWLRSSVYARCGSVVGSQSGAYAETSRPRTRSGNMFSTAKRIAVSSAIRSMPWRKPRA